MKYIFTSLLLCLTLYSSGQPSFQGKIEYKVHLAGEKEAAKMVLSFGVNKIKMELLVPGKADDNDYVIIDLDSGYIHSMDVRDKSYETKALYKTREAKLPPAGKIAGYGTTTVFQQHKTGQSEDPLDYLSTGYFDIADDLYYAVPGAYAEGNAELMMVIKGKIVLGAHIIDLKKQRNRTEAADWKADDNFAATAVATSVIPMKMDAAFFMVPAGFKEKGAITFQEVELAPVKDKPSPGTDTTNKLSPGTKPTGPVQKRSSRVTKSTIPIKKH